MRGGHVLHEIREHVAGAQQQRTATEQVVASMAEIEDVTRQTTQASKQSTGAASELTGLAGRLAELIKRFKAD